MKCKIEGCDSECRYMEQRVCQKHYFRMMRYGTYELIKKGKRKSRSQNARGYQMLHMPEHPLAMANGCVYEHRAVIYAKYGENLPDCEICGKPLNWLNAHIDHIDENVINNSESNLRPLCVGCNTVTNIQQVKWQRERDLHEEQTLIQKEGELERSLEYVREKLREVRNRLGTNKPGNDPEAA